MAVRPNGLLPHLGRFFPFAHAGHIQGARIACGIMGLFELHLHGIRYIYIATILYIYVWTILIDMMYLSFICLYVYIGTDVYIVTAVEFVQRHLGKQRKQRRCQLAPLAVSYPVQGFEQFLWLLQSLVYVKTNNRSEVFFC